MRQFYTGLGIVRGMSMVVLALALGASEARSEISFLNKKIEVLIGSEAGGGTDGTTRLLARYLAKYLPGTPTMVIRNMPGARGTLALNHFVTSPTVKPDGLTWVGGGSAHIDANAVLRPQVKYDPDAFQYIGAVSRGGSFLLLRKEKAQNLTDKSLPPAIVGTIDGAGSWEQAVMFGQKGLNWNAKFVLGYRGTQELLVAIQRGEIDMIGTANAPFLMQMLETGSFVMVAQEGTPEELAANDQRSAFGAVPPIGNLLAGKLTGVAADAFQFWSLTRQVDKWYALPVGTPAEIVDVYRKAYDNAVIDPEFLKYAYAQFSEDFKALSGATFQTLVTRTTHPGKAILDLIDSMKAENGIRSEGAN